MHTSRQPSQSLFTRPKNSSVSGRFARKAKTLPTLRIDPVTLEACSIFDEKKNLFTTECGPFSSTMHPEACPTF